MTHCNWFGYEGKKSCVSLREQGRRVSHEGLRLSGVCLLVLTPYNIIYDPREEGRESREHKDVPIVLTNPAIICDVCDGRNV